MTLQGLRLTFSSLDQWLVTGLISLAEIKFSLAAVLPICFTKRGGRKVRQFLVMCVKKNLAHVC